MTRHDSLPPVAVIGAGVVGAGWAARFLLHGREVRVFDPSTAATARLDAVLAAARRSLPMLAEVAMPHEGALHITGSVAEAVDGAVWVQESAPERLDAKHALVAEIERHCPNDAIVASSTSGFRPSALAEGATRPERVIVAHPFNPVYLLPLVELVGDERTVARAAALLERVGMYPLPLRREIDAHLADRFLEAVWREALWLVRDDVATTAEIDEAIRMGFGLRWAQMGLFETYRVAGGEAGMAHFIAQFGPALGWPWTRLTDVPELDEALVAKIAAQSDAQSDGCSIAELERRRDDNLVAILRALKGRDQGAGTVLNRHDARLRAFAAGDDSASGESDGRAVPVTPPAAAAKTPVSRDPSTDPAAPAGGTTDGTIGTDGDGAPMTVTATTAVGRHTEANDSRPEHLGGNPTGADVPPPMPRTPFETIRRSVPIDWTDYNGHMNESRYGQLFSDAADAVLALIGAGPDYVARELSWFTVDIRIRFLAETHAAERIVVRTQVLDGGGKKLRLFHTLERDVGEGDGARNGTTGGNDETLGDGEGGNDHARTLATGEQLLIHVSLATRRACPPEAPVGGRLAALVAAQSRLPRPNGASS